MQFGIFYDALYVYDIVVFLGVDARAICNLAVYVYDVVAGAGICDEMILDVTAKI